MHDVGTAWQCIYMIVVPRLVTSELNNLDIQAFQTYPLPTFWFWVFGQASQILWISNKLADILDRVCFDSLILPVPSSLFRIPYPIKEKGVELWPLLPNNAHPRSRFCVKMAFIFRSIPLAIRLSLAGGTTYGTAKIGVWSSSSERQDRWKEVRKSLYEIEYPVVAKHSHRSNPGPVSAWYC